MNQFYKNLALWLVIGMIMIALFNIFNQPLNNQSDVIFSEFMDQVESGKISEVTIQGDRVSGKYIDGSSFQTMTPSKDQDLVRVLREKGVRIVVVPPEQTSWYMNILISWFPMILLLGIWIFFMRQMQSGGGKALSFGKSKARLMNEDKNKITFKDVAGVDEAKEELHEIIEFLKEPQKFNKLGGKIPKGVLLVGPPGTGKTLLAKAIAGEANVPFFSISGSDFVEMFVGVGASRVRDLFEQGKKNSPCIIFIDEIDAVGRHRGAGLGGGHDEREQTLNQLLVEMDGFDTSEGVILVAATNRPDVLDPALLRPGRFDRQIVVDLPTVKGREEIFKVHSSPPIKLGDDVDMSVLARSTPYFSGADIANMVNEAALLAAKEDKEAIDQACLDEAKDRVMMGPERRSMMLSDEERQITAYHEAGHAVLNHFLPESDPNYKCTIIPRGRALGVTIKLPAIERHNYGKKFLLSEIVVLLGGRVAEEIMFGEQTTGAQNDFERSTSMARKMVMQWGMSQLGPLAFGKRDEQVFLGKEISHHQDYSEDTAIEIDRAVKQIINECYDQARTVVETNLDGLKKLAAGLLEHETLVLSQIEEILGPRPQPSS